eukprot:scaffold31744_cov58-Phaeocystis_antarctica.AAC.1
MDGRMVRARREPGEPLAVVHDGERCKGPRGRRGETNTGTILVCGAGPRALLVRVSEVVRVSDKATHLTCTVTCTFTLTVTLDLSLSLTLTLTRPRPNLTLTSTVLQRCDIPNRQMAVPSSEPSQPSRVQPPAVVVLGHADTHVPGLSP